MALAAAIQGATRPGQLVTWQVGAGVENLTGATLTGTIRNGATGATRAITGTLAVVDGPNGDFLWSYSEADVADAGNFSVQFTAEFASGATPARTFATQWTVHAAQVAS